MHKITLKKASLDQIVYCFKILSPLHKLNVSELQQYCKKKKNPWCCCLQNSSMFNVNETAGSRPVEMQIQHVLLKLAQEECTEMQPMIHFPELLKSCMI